VISPSNGSSMLNMAVVRGSGTGTVAETPTGLNPSRNVNRFASNPRGLVSFVDIFRFSDVIIEE
jgi:hypothetical protein